jgi:hypothetical protein
VAGQVFRKNGNELLRITGEKKMARGGRNRPEVENRNNERWWTGSLSRVFVFFPERHRNTPYLSDSATMGKIFIDSR